MSESEDKAKILSAMGGVKGLIDSGLPALLFLIAFNITKDVRDSAYAALALSLLLTIVRLVKRETIQHSIGGLIGVGICFLIATRTGKAEDFYLPGLWTNAIYGTAYLISILLRWPVIGLIIGPL
ncbi:MAG TPA: DUF3159 domain-containing protein, partial [Actinobacteria bacterium]|nr:DUF3159 domain-containing protein [Actinomycetota bacterium]